MAESGLTVEERKEVDVKIRHLINACKSFISRGELRRIRKAVDVNIKYYIENSARNTDPYVKMPFEVARIAAEEIGMGATTIICSLLFKPVEDKHISLDEVRKEYGEAIADIIEGVNAISLISSSQSLKSDNLRKYLMTLAKDVRVLIIQLAIRLCKLRHLNYFPVNVHERIALEASVLFSPLAHRLGLYNMKGELDDLAMKVTMPDVYLSIDKRLQETQKERVTFVSDIIVPLQKSLDRHKIKCEIKWRTKRVHSIYRKMKQQNVEFDEVYDKFAIRLIIDTKAKTEKSECWRAYSLVTEIYKPNPKRLRDWISIPKSTGYESLHTTVMSKLGKWVEIQIRTKRMDEIAEKGFAAHWRYKGGQGEEELDKLLNGFREVLEHPDMNVADVIDGFKMNVYSDEVFVFTPKGDLKKLPKGSTVLDFAFEIHTDVGSKCVGAKVNNKVVPLRHELRNGDQIEVQTSKNQKPKSDWLNYVVTSKAKIKVKRVIDEEKYKIAEDGKEIVKRKLKNWKFNFDDLTINKLLKQYRCKTAIDLYYQVAVEKINMLEIKAFLSEEKPAAPAVNEQEVKVHGTAASTSSISFNDPSLKGIKYKYAKCCKPVKGDDVIGFVTLAGEISIHRKSCGNAIRMSERFGYREIAVNWGDSSGERIYTLKLVGEDRLGIVNDVTMVVANDAYANLRSIMVDTKDKEFEGIIKVLINDGKNVDVLIQRLLKIKGLIKVLKIEAK